jgi:hypothetical protein
MECHSGFILKYETKLENFDTLAYLYAALAAKKKIVTFVSVEPFQPRQYL